MKSLRISSCLLPEELITEILLKLPVKSLLRFKSVSHSWNSLITSPNFKNSDGFLLYWTKAAVFEEDDDSVYEHTDHMFIDYHAFSFFPDQRLENHRVAHYGWFPNSIRKIYGPCKGVVCVLQAGDRLCLCNPYTKGFRQLPDFHPQFHGVVDFGFGVDPITDEFKVVLIRESGNLLHSAVWNSSYKCWRLFEQERVLSDPDAKYSRAIYTNGFCYWMKYNRMTGSSVILAFDTSNDSFQEIKMPQQQIVTSLHEVELDLYNDYLAILTYTFEIVDIWLMEEKGCWRKVHTVVLPSKIDQVGVWKRNRIFASTGKGLMILYDPDSSCTTKIHVKTENDRFTYYSPPMPYKESVVSV